VVDGKCSAELIASEGVDYRFKKHSGATAKFSISLPEPIVAVCARLNEVFKAPFLGVDFKIRSADGEFFFLEANSMPAYHGYDIRANYEISTALRDYLCQ
jgi:glutathione synthase/RimK-type ligase-like ATP-grasp enzyme